MIVESEGGIPTIDLDVLSFFDRVFPHGLEYQRRLLRPRFMTPLYQRIIRQISSPRRLPDAPRSFGPLSRIETDALVVGHGIAGSAATGKLRALGIAPVTVDWRGIDLVPPSTAFGYYEDGSVGVVSETGGMLVRAKAVLLATGRVETGLAIPNADLPGVLLPEAVEHLVSRGISPGSGAFIIGNDERRAKVLSRLKGGNCEVVGESPDPRNVLRIRGGRRVRSIEVLSVDGKKERHSCDLVVLLGPQVPDVALAQQAGCQLEVGSGLWHVKTLDLGRTSAPNIFSCGGVAGATSPIERALSGERAAQGMAGFLGVN
jgi:hypothetical protein